MNKLKDLLHELRCDISSIPVNKENNTEIKNAQETLAKAFNELWRLYDVVGQSEQLPNSHCCYNRERCIKQSACKYPNCNT